MVIFIEFSLIEVSHALVDPNSITREITERVIAIALGICIKYHPLHIGSGISASLGLTDFIEFLNTISPSLQKCYNFVTNYKACFHPIVHLQMKMTNIEREWKELRKLIDQVNPAVINPLQEQAKSTLDQIEGILKGKLGTRPLFSLCSTEVAFFFNDITIRFNLIYLPYFQLQRRSLVNSLYYKAYLITAPNSYPR